MERLKECAQGERMTVLMSLALDGMLDSSDRQRLEEHMKTCVACRTEWQAMAKVAALFEESPAVGPPLGFAVRVERRLEDQAKKKRRTFGGLAVATGSLSLIGATVAAVLILVLGIAAWRWFDTSPSLQQGTQTVTQVASGVGLMGKGASLFLGDLLLRYGAPLVLVLGVGLLVLLGVWAWLLVKRPGGTHHNGFA
ncbi:MAG: anti-sigma factor family protein [Anaerolineae bacterium]|jgi:predicted anti-sigma-YlaC factor YlaD